MTDLKAPSCGELTNLEHSVQTERLLSLLERRGLVEDPSIRNDKARAAGIAPQYVSQHPDHAQALPGYCLGS